MGDDKITFVPNGEREIPDRLAEYMDDTGVDNTSKAVCAVVDEGLTAMGYEPSYSEASDRLLSGVRGVASVLGVTALILFGVGVWLPVYSQYGFGLAVMSIAFFAGAEIAERHGEEIYTWVKRMAAKEADNWTAEG